MKIAARFVKQGTVLDIGCGEGMVLNYIEERLPYLGLDVNADCINKAKGIWEYRNNTEFRTMSLDENLKLNQKFDSIVLLAVIEHLVSPEKCLTILKTYLKEKGRMIVTTPGPFAEKILNIGSRFGLFDKEAQKEHKKIFNKKELYQLTAAAGLRINYHSTFECGLNHIMVMVHA